MYQTTADGSHTNNKTLEPLPLVPVRPSVRLSVRLPLYLSLSLSLSFPLHFCAQLVKLGVIIFPTSAQLVATCRALPILFLERATTVLHLVDML